MDCHVEWARALGAYTRSGALRLRDDGTVVATVYGGYTPLHIDGLSLGGTLGSDLAYFLLSFDEEGMVRWARDAQGPLVWAHDDEVLSVRQHTYTAPAALERLTADGVLLSEETQPQGTRWLAITQSACASGCMTRELRVAAWNERIDLGVLGVIEAPFGFTVLMLEDGTPRWHWSSPLPESFDPVIVLPHEGVLPDGSVTLAIWSHTAPRRAPFCLAGVPCANFPETLVVGLSPEGRPQFANVVAPTQALVLTDDGGFITNTARDVSRFDASGVRLWTNDRLGDRVTRIAADALTGEIWVAIGVPESPIELAGTTIAGCGRGHDYSVLLNMDPLTGAVVRTRTAFLGWVAAIETHSAGGVAVQISPRGRPSSFSICDRVVSPDHGPTEILSVVIARLE